MAFSAGEILLIVLFGIACFWAGYRTGIPEGKIEEQEKEIENEETN